LAGRVEDALQIGSKGLPRLVDFDGHVLEERCDARADVDRARRISVGV
jgi:hypothetical protein